MPTDGSVAVAVAVAVAVVGAVANRTRWPAWEARMAGPVARCEVQGAKVGDERAFEAAGVVEIELLHALAGRKVSGPDAALPPWDSPWGLPLQAGDEELLARPGLLAGRSASRGTAARSVGAFSGRVLKETSEARSRPVVVPVTP